MLADDKCYLADGEGNRLGTVISKLRKGSAKGYNYNVKMARTYEYISAIGKDDTDNHD